MTLEQAARRLYSVLRARGVDAATVESYNGRFVVYLRTAHYEIPATWYGRTVRVRLVGRTSSPLARTEERHAYPG